MIGKKDEADAVFGSAAGAAGGRTGRKTVLLQDDTLDSPSEKSGCC